MGVNIKGGNNSSGLANVSGTYELQVVTPQVEDNAGFVQISSEVDDGTVTGTRTVLSPEVSDDYRLRVGLDQTIFNMSFEGTNFPQAHLQQNLTTMTVGISAGWVSLNGSAITTVNTVANVRTYRHFPTFGTYPTYVEMWIRENNYDASNSQAEWGLMHLASTTSQTAPIDGVFFRRLAGGALKAVINYGGLETEYTIDTTNVLARDGSGAYSPAESSHYLIAYHNDEIRFWINDHLCASVGCPSNQPAFTMSSNSPLHFRVINQATTPSAARRLDVGYINVGIGDQSTVKSWNHVLSGSGNGAYQTQIGSASAITPNYVNITAPTPGSFNAASNTTTPMYTTLGGQWAAGVTGFYGETDAMVFSYQVPAATLVTPGKSLYVTSVRVGETWISNALSNHNHVLQWGIGVANNAISQATTDAATTVAPRRVPLGAQTLFGFGLLGMTGSVSLQGAGTTGYMAPGFQVDFNSAPLVAPPGTYVSIICRDIAYTPAAGGATGQLRGTVAVMGYWE